MAAAQIRIWSFLVIAIATKVVEVSAGECTGAIEDIQCLVGGSCFWLTWICDGDDDCGDQSDESFCVDKGPNVCSKDLFQCSNDTCIPRSGFCDGKNNCGDNSDEFYCNLINITQCPPRWIPCDDRRRCIPENCKCDGLKDCNDGSDEKACSSYDPVKVTPIGSGSQKIEAAMNKSIKWLLNRKKNDSSTNKWGDHLHRIATTLYLVDERFFAPGNATGEEMGYELTIQLLDKLSGNSTIRTQELALYIQALLVTCADPKDFFNHNLVSELRGIVERTSYGSPFEILVLCTAGDTMTDKDFERVSAAFDSQHRPLWTDTQAIATMALQCLYSSPNVKVDERTVKEMEDELKKRQFKNGTVDNLMTTALVAQALLYNESYKEFFNMEAATYVLLESQNKDGSWGSVQNSYYVLPVLSSKSILNVSSKHCSKSPETEEDVLKKLQNARGDKFVVQFSVWIGNDVDLGRTWRMRMTVSGNYSFYDVIETVTKLDPRYAVKYNVVDHKPFVFALLGKENDPVLGVYWFTYVRSLLLPEAGRLVEASPVDVKIHPNQELILWYKPGSWSENSHQEE